ncbi:SAM-dependent methyltransferase [Halobacillus halophilus]|uniref:site-specific DNA-methyltransferase (adenine-specific) n=1 Tax=Halobacillus halophilus (strain ATCC 35676 / DSM 2266 / JCM 20832 / KCTC 3685 / LMG 17431 / NBRC 102448 / NCIMB 2269) TaxID=866895 RepID=I0JTE7_HALH3|nr:BREX-1 system adenine-specific DNA-methyltransferase PglX [Halobacillus halophilus]ASF41330.1 SAM-dependent methyltransferase [Halobacillus halophilus]CCG47419.1 conserved hypothetical protein [Halobacillus halophilus DSM 2266]
MNKAELKRFAVEARRDLIDKVSLKAEQYGITENDQELKVEENYGQLYVNGKSYDTEMKQSFRTLQQRLNNVGYNQLIEEISYTWFNRIIAMRYMEVNNYLPDKVNVLSSSTGKNDPDILLQFETMNLDVKHQKVSESIQEGDNEKAYRSLLIAQCNALNQLLPFLFEKIEDYTELLLPDYLLDQESIIRKIVNELSDENFYHVREDGVRSDNVEVLGWLYQYYMSEKKEQVGGLRNNAVKKEDLPVVTQLFTPKWIVQYMVQNSLGKLYDEKYEDNQLSQHWEYYFKHKENHHLYPRFDSLEDLKIMDPACGSGHILIYSFDMLYDMYEEAGYPSREIPQLILENNLYGLDIDKRAQQIANFALLMKAAEKQPRFISRLSRKGKSPKLNVYEIVEADQTLSEEAINYFAENKMEKSFINELLSQFENGKQFGSLINPIELPYEEWINRLYNLDDQKVNLLDESYIKELKVKLLPIIEQANLLYQRYEVVITNPPYHSRYNKVLKKYMNEKYKDYKTDLYSSFIYQTKTITKDNGYFVLVTPYTWMFISTHEKLRKNLLQKSALSSLIHLNYSAFSEATVPICAFVAHKQTKSTLGVYLKLSKYKSTELSSLVKEAAKENRSYKYIHKSEEFFNFPGNRIAYWATESVKSAFKNHNELGGIAQPRAGLQTGNNDRFLRLWYEVGVEDIGFNMSNLIEAKNSNKKWFPYNKGGAYRKWYGNQYYVVNWEKDGEEIKELATSKYKNYTRTVKNINFYFREGLTWSDVNSQYFGIRYSPKGFIFDVKGSSLFTNNKDFLSIILGFLTSKVSSEMLELLNPTISFQTGDLKSLPIIEPTNRNLVKELVESSVQIAKDEWESYEISWDFKQHPFITNIKEIEKISEANSCWKEKVNNYIQQLRKNEQSLNEIFIKTYGLEGELSPKVEEKDITIRNESRINNTKSFLSYFIGCVMGRYSLDVEGLAYAGGQFDESIYQKFIPNHYGLIQLTDDHYFDKDIIVRLREFLSVTFSPDTVDENMEWLAESLIIKKNESPEERLRRYFLDEFFKNHCKTYQKRPIYWLVDSGKQKGLRTLIYMHRYQPDTMATIRFEHLQEIQSKYQNEIDMIDTRLANPSLSATDRRSLEKSRTAFQKKIDELQEFDKHLATYANEQIDIDLDDGVKMNYAKFYNVLAKIK